MTTHPTSDIPDPKSQTPHRLAVQELATGDWLKLLRIEYVDGHGQQRTWESAARRFHTGAVVMIPRLHPSGDFILVEQYRPPIDRMVLEFPAGLIDAGEAPAATALRELREETGFIGTLRWLSQDGLSSPGMSGESVFLALLDVDETRPENQVPKTQFDASEQIQTCRVPAAEVAAFLRRRQDAGVILDSKVISFFLGAGMTW